MKRRYAFDVALHPLFDVDGAVYVVRYSYRFKWRALLECWMRKAGPGLPSTSIAIPGDVYEVYE